LLPLNNKCVINIQLKKVLKQCESSVCYLPLYAHTLILRIFLLH